MKKYISYIVIFLLIIILGYYSSLHYKEKNTLTKERIWSIINNVDGTLLGSMTKNGEKELSNESKVDYIIKYIIENESKYIDIIEDSNTTLEKYNTTYYNFGKVKEKSFYKLVCDIFYSFDYNLEYSHFYNNRYIELFFEPIEYISCDSKQISSYYIYKGKIYMYIKYTRFMGDISNEFIVKYVFDKNTYKICNFVILNSNLN